MVALPILEENLIKICVVPLFLQNGACEEVQDQEYPVERKYIRVMVEESPVDETVRVGRPRGRADLVGGETRGRGRGEMVAVVLEREAGLERKGQERDIWTARDHEGDCYGFCVLVNTAFEVREGGMACMHLKELERYSGN